MFRRIAAIGDSIVQGKVDEPSGGWVGRLRKWHVGKDPRGHAIFNLGIGGETSVAVAARVRSECTPRRIDTLLLGFGVNDIRRIGSMNAETMVQENQYRSHLLTSLATATSIAQNIAFVSMSPIDEARTKPFVEDHYYSLQDQEKFESIARAACRDARIPYIDVWSKSIKLGSAQLSHDGMHPNSAGHTLIFDLVRSWLELL